MLPETPYVLYMQLQHQATHRNGAIKHIFYTNQIHGGIISRLFFIRSFGATHALALFHSGSKYYSNLSARRFEHVGFTYICRLYFPPECQQDRTLLRKPIRLSENIPIFDINHQQNTRRSDQIETIKTIMQTTRPRITWKVLPMAQVAIFKEIFDQVRKDLDCELFYSELKKTSQRLTLYLLSSHR